MPNAPKKLPPYATVRIDEYDIKKAGFVVYGRNKDGQLCILATYTQGRFDDSARKYYGLAKGSVDEGEDPITGGKREAREESGISIKKLIGEENMARLRKNEDVVPYESAEYKGVKVVRGHATPSDFAYMSSSGKHRRMNVFFIEVENIEALDQKHSGIKRPPISSYEASLAERFTWEQPHLELTADQYTRDHRYPTMKEMLDILRTGTLAPTKEHPAELQWVPNHTKEIITNPDFPKLEKAWLEKHGFKDKTITDPNDWRRFCKETEHDNADAYSKLEKDFLKIKGYFNSTKICGDREFIKMDEKDRPLNFFFEGGEVIPLTHFITRSAQAAEHNDDYRLSMWGEYEGNKHPPRTRNQMSYAAQIGGVLPRDGQPLEDSEIFSSRAALDILRTIEKGVTWAERAPAVHRIGGLANVLQAEAKGRR